MMLGGLVILETPQAAAGSAPTVSAGQASWLRPCHLLGWSPGGSVALAGDRGKGPGPGRFARRPGRPDWVGASTAATGPWLRRLVRPRQPGRASVAVPPPPATRRPLRPNKRPWSRPCQSRAYSAPPNRKRQDYP